MICFPSGARCTPCRTGPGTPPARTECTLQPPRSVHSMLPHVFAQPPSAAGMSSHSLSARPAPLGFKFSSRFTYFRVTFLLTSLCLNWILGSLFFCAALAWLFGVAPALDLIFLLCLQREHTSVSGQRGCAHFFPAQAPSHRAQSQRAL